MSYPGRPQHSWWCPRTTSPPSDPVPSLAQSGEPSPPGLASVCKYDEVNLGLGLVTWWLLTWSDFYFCWLRWRSALESSLSSLISSSSSSSPRVPSCWRCWTFSSWRCRSPAPAPSEGQAEVQSELLLFRIHFLLYIEMQEDIWDIQHWILASTFKLLKKM